jgi:hypothetical protein
MYGNGGGRGQQRGPALSIDVQNANRAGGTGGRYGAGQASQRKQYAMAEAEAQAIMQEDEEDSTDEAAEALQQGQQQQHHSHQQQGESGQGDVMDDEGMEEGLEEEGSFSDSLSSSPSIPDEDIDFNLVYALHTFLATVDGQASVVKGDKLLLLDDTNSYWWLVRVLKTQAVGYIPAENIETPHERLARLNKHRNVDVSFYLSPNI